MLFSVTVVYGRLASDNEVIAVKTAGLSAMTVLWPSIFLGGALSGTLLYLSFQAIPRANHYAKLAIFKNFEEAFYKVLKMEREFNNPGWPFFIKVRDVDLETRVMSYATFKHRDKKDPNKGVDLIVQAERAKINFHMDDDPPVALVYLDNSEISGGRNTDEDVFLVNDRVLEMPLPENNDKGYEKKAQEWTFSEMSREQAKYRRLIARERKLQAMGAALRMASGHPERIDWEHVQAAFVDYNYWTRRIAEFETEKQLRIAQSFGPLVFVVLGAPVGILFARRDFLSAFISCFVPIILLYYPLMLLGVNLGKEDVLDPTYALWGGNLLLVVLSGFVLPPVIKH
jgi:lipopolysaccharide export system permease protein